MHSQMDSLNVKVETLDEKLSQLERTLTEKVTKIEQTMLQKMDRLEKLLERISPLPTNGSLPCASPSRFDDVESTTDISNGHAI